MKITETLDLRGFPCPGNLPKLIIKLETMSKGEVLELIVDDIIALDRIPLALKEEPEFKLISHIQKENNNIHLYIKVK